MRVSFLVLVVVIAVCNANANAKAVRFVTEDEVNGASQSPVERGPKKDTACETDVKQSIRHGEDHILNKREISSDLGRKLSALSKKSDRKKIESKKFKYEARRTKTVSNKTRSVKKDKYESQKDKNRRGRFAFGHWYVPHIRPKTFSFPLIYSAPNGYNGWTAQNNFQTNTGIKEYESRILLPKDILKLEELTEVLRNSFREGLESLFDAIEKELKKKLEQEGTPEPIVPVAPNVNARSSCIDTGDGSCESESTYDAYDAVSPNDCPDDTATHAHDSDGGIGLSDMSKRSESSLEFFKEALPVIVQAAESILGGSVENKKPVAGGFGDDVARVVSDDELDDRRSSAWGLGDEAAEPVPDDGTENERPVPWDYDEDRVPVG